MTYQEYIDEYAVVAEKYLQSDNADTQSLGRAILNKDIPLYIRWLNCLNITADDIERFTWKIEDFRGNGRFWEMSGILPNPWPSLVEDMELLLARMKTVAS